MAIPAPGLGGFETDVVTLTLVGINLDSDFIAERAIYLATNSIIVGYCKCLKSLLRKTEVFSLHAGAREAAKSAKHPVFRVFAASREAGPRFVISAM